MASPIHLRSAASTSSSRRRAIMFVVWGAAVALTLVVMRAGGGGGAVLVVPEGHPAPSNAPSSSPTRPATPTSQVGAIVDRSVAPQPRTAQPGIAGTCGGAAATNCLACLFGSSSSSSDDCVWCASERRCIAASEPCSDVESTSCPAVTHTPPPQTIRVIHVAIRKGGPEALIQMHLALNHEGFKTTLDTRRSKKQKGGPVVPFFAEMYASEFAKAPPLRYEANYDAWLASAAEGDVMMSTETWACKNDWSKELAAGARQMQWHLTVWPKKPRTGCTISAHTNHIAQEYMQTPRRAVLFPYISPHIVKLAQEKTRLDGGRGLRRGKQNLVMYDGDVKLNDADVKPRWAKWSVRKATGFTPQDLYQKYAEAKVGIDLVLPGAERFVYEASLFDVCIIVDDTANGADPSDLPLPQRFRVQPNNLSAMHERINECVENYDTVITEQRALKTHTLQQRDTFHRHVRRYFSNSVHVVTYIDSTSAAEFQLTPFVLHTLIALPFASIEIRHAPGVKFPAKQIKALKDASYLAAVTFTEVADDKQAWHPSTNAKRVGYVALMPPSTVLLAGDYLHVASSAIALLMLFQQQRQHHQIRSDPSPPAVLLFHEGLTVVFPASDLERVKPHLPSRHFESATDDRDIGTATAVRLREHGVAVQALDVDAKDADDVTLQRFRKRVGMGSFVGLTMQWGAEMSGQDGRSWGQLRDRFEKLEDDATLPAALSNARLARGVDAGAGDRLTHREYLCTHPFYAASLPEVCSAA